MILRRITFGSKSKPAWTFRTTIHSRQINYLAYFVPSIIQSHRKTNVKIIKIHWYNINFAKNDYVIKIYGDKHMHALRRLLPKQIDAFFEAEKMINGVAPCYCDVNYFFFQIHLLGKNDLTSVTIRWHFTLQVNLLQIWLSMSDFFMCFKFSIILQFC